MIGGTNNSANRVEHFFELWPHTVRGWSKNITLRGGLERWPGTIGVIFRLSGNLENIRWPISSILSKRRDKLWQETCFEIFISPKNTSEYWEVNLSPAGCWNVYHFNSYRSGMQEEGRMASPSGTSGGNDAFRWYSFTLDIAPIIGDGCDVDLGVSAVIQGGDGSHTYWAMAHFGQAPDFHDQRNFLACLHGLDTPGSSDQD